MSKALIHVKPVRKPISEEVIGFRLEAAIPNMAGRVMRARQDGDSVVFRATKEEAPSFRKPYLIEQSSDHNAIDRRKVERFMDALRWAGYDEFELIGKYAGEPLAALMN